MDRNQIQAALTQLQKNSPKRNFKQSIDLIFNLRGINIKNPEQQVNIFATFQHDFGKNVSVCALVGPELEPKAKAACNEVVLADDFDKFKNKKDIKKLAEKHDFFIAQANLMGKIATVFGRVLGPRGKMPNPKVGAVVAPNANLEPLVARLKLTIQLVTKNDPTIRCMVGREDSPVDHVVDNVMTAYKTVLQKLPNDVHNVKNVMIKYTMSPPVVVGSQVADEEEGGKGAKGKKGKKLAKKAKTPKKQESKPAKQEVAPEEASE